MAPTPRPDHAAAFQPVSQPDTTSRSSSFSEEPQGRANFGMSNLRPGKTGLPFIVFIPQRDEASHGVGIKVSPAPRVRRDRTGSYALRPALERKAGWGTGAKEGALLHSWVELNQAVLIDYCNGVIADTEDALARIRSIWPGKRRRPRTDRLS